MRTLIATVALGLSTLASVSHAQQQPQSLPPVTTDAAANTVTVQNQRDVPVAIWVDNGRFDRGLGTVPALGTATLALPDWAVRGPWPIQISARAKGDVLRYATQPFTPKPPARLSLLVEAWGQPRSAWTDTMATYVDSEDRDETTLTVDNPRDVPCVVTAEPGLFEIKLGQVPAGGRATLRFPRSVIGVDRTLRVYVRPEGSHVLRSDYVLVRQGQHLALKVPAL